MSIEFILQKIGEILNPPPLCCLYPSHPFFCFSLHALALFIPPRGEREGR